MTTKSINELQEEVIEEFSAFDDWMDKYQMLIDLGNELSPLSEKYKVENNLIEAVKAGCGCNATLLTGYLFLLQTATH